MYMTQVEAFRKIASFGQIDSGETVETVRSVPCAGFITRAALIETLAPDTLEVAAPVYVKPPKEVRRAALESLKAIMRARGMSPERFDFTPVKRATQRWGFGGFHRGEPRAHYWAFRPKIAAGSWSCQWQNYELKGRDSENIRVVLEGLRVLVYGANGLIGNGQTFKTRAKMAAYLGSIKSLYNGANVTIEGDIPKMAAASRTAARKIAVGIDTQAQQELMTLKKQNAELLAQLETLKAAQVAPVAQVETQAQVAAAPQSLEDWARSYVAEIAAKVPDKARKLEKSLAWQLGLIGTVAGDVWQDRARRAFNAKVA